MGSIPNLILRSTTGMTLPLKLMTPFRYTALTTAAPGTTALRDVESTRLGWTLQGHRLVADLPANGAAATLELLSPDGRILSRMAAVSRDGRMEWNLGSESGVRLFRIEAQGRTAAVGKVVLP